MPIISQKIKNGGIDPSYYDKTARAESGGRSDARNPNSSASGEFQFIKSTWRAVVDKYGLKYTDEDRFNKAKSREVMELFTRDNAEQLKQYGIQPNNTDLYTAHFMGVGGAKKLLQTQRENPNASVYDVATPAQIKANKSIFLNKDGSPKTVGQVYQILGDKINKTKNYKETPSQITTNQTDLQIPTQSSNLASVPDQPEEELQVVEAKQELQQKQNEENFINDLYANAQQEEQPIQQPLVQPQQTNVLEKYAQIESFVDSPTLQQGGKIIDDNNGQWRFPGEITRISSPNITMKNVPYNVLGIADTGEQKMMRPSGEYFFEGAKTVTEYPQLTEKEKAFLKAVQNYRKN